MVDAHELHEIGFERVTGLEVLSAADQLSVQVGHVHEVDEEARFLRQEERVKRVAVVGLSELADRGQTGQERGLAHQQRGLTLDAVRGCLSDDRRFVLELLRDEIVGFVEGDGREHHEGAHGHRHRPTDERAEQARREELTEESHESRLEAGQDLLPFGTLHEVDESLDRRLHFCRLRVVHEVQRTPDRIRAVRQGVPGRGDVVDPAPRRRC